MDQGKELLQFLADEASELMMQASRLGPMEAQPLKREAEELCYLRAKIARRLADGTNVDQMELPLSKAA